jgi:hypothetical protein
LHLRAVLVELVVEVLQLMVDATIVFLFLLGRFLIFHWNVVLNHESTLVISSLLPPVNHVLLDGIQLPKDVEVVIILDLNLKHAGK